MLAIFLIKTFKKKTWESGWDGGTGGEPSDRNNPDSHHYL